MSDFLLDHCPGILVKTNLSGVVLDSNRDAQQALGVTSLRGKTLHELVHPDDQVAFAAVWSEISKSKDAVRAVSRFQGVDAHQRLAWTAQRDPERDEVHAVFVPLPATEQRLDDPAPILRAMLDNCDISVSVFDREGRFVFQEGKGLAAGGLSPGQFLGQSIFELYDAHVPEQMALLRKTMTDGEARFWTGNLHDALWETSVFAMRDESGAIIGATIATIDKSAVKRTMVDLKTKLEIIERQQEVIRNLETPIIQVWDRVLTLPMVGIVDSQRAARLMDDLLQMVSSKGALYAILDLTGVEIVDTASALHLFQMVDAIRLLGAEGIISGIRPTVAQTMVALGLDLTRVRTCADLQAALRFCIRRMMDADKMPNSI